MRSNFVDIIKCKRTLRVYTEYLRVVLKNHDIKHAKTVIPAIRIELYKFRKLVSEVD